MMPLGRVLGAMMAPKAFRCVDTPFPTSIASHKPFSLSPQYLHQLDIYQKSRLTIRPREQACSEGWPLPPQHSNVSLFPVECSMKLSSRHSRARSFRPQVRLVQDPHWTASRRQCRRRNCFAQGSRRPGQCILGVLGVVPWSGHRQERHH